MDTLESVAVRLAERIAPDEAELAPAIAEAAARGGREWQRLVGPSGGAMHGGNIPVAEFAGELTQLFAVLKDCASIVASFCLMGSASLSIVVSRYNLRDRKQRLADNRDQTTLDQTVEAILRELEKRGIGRARAEEMTQHTLVTLAERPEEGKRFIDGLRSAR